MPSRTDTRDALVLRAFYGRLDLEFVDTAIGADLRSKAYPQESQVADREAGDNAEGRVRHKMHRGASYIAAGLEAYP
jgi:hypothetical protein